jgi:hypothetical protein
MARVAGGIFAGVQTSCENHRSTTILVPLLGGLLVAAVVDVGLARMATVGRRRRGARRYTRGA